ncbi:MAG: multicopper oxidase domain-containing protein [Kouleothrix sp.]|nr:multicopper oxidase domain-containing protein [Kouleothrix sp.]
MVTRRQFFKLGLAGTALVLVDYKAGVKRAYALPIPGGTIEPTSVGKFATPLLIPPAMPRAGKLTAKGGKNVDYYEIAVRQLKQQILPAGLPMTTVWGYGPKVAQNGPAIFHAPSLTIEAKVGTPVRVKWINELVDANGNYLPHLLPVDPTLHWANPPGGTMHRDTRPMFESTPGRYTGPVPTVTHVHGAVGVGDESDGYPEAWFLPAARNIPAGYAAEGTWYDYFKGKASSRFGATWQPGSATFQYPNTQRASTIWYHDHALGMTRLNVYAGPAGFYIIRGGPSDKVLDSRNGAAAVLPGPAPALGDAADTKYYEIPIAIQDRSFNSDGSLFYPDSRAFFDGVEDHHIPDGDVSPIWNPEFFGNCIIVNGNTWPSLQVEQRRYRFRLLNGCDARFLILNFASMPGVQVWQIGNEGGFLAAPVNMTAVNGNRILMSPAERADVIVDFTNVPRGSHILQNLGPDEPFKGFTAEGELSDGEGGTLPPADAETTGQVIAFRVVKSTGADKSTPPQFLQLPPIAPIVGGTVRRLALLEEMSIEVEDAPIEARLGTVDADGVCMPQMWMEGVTENPMPGDTEVWEFYNTTADAHPMHIHEVVFQVVNRQAILLDEEEQEQGMGVKKVAVDPSSPPRPPEPWENGLKDTVIAYPGEVTRVRAKFENPGQFVWHCHIVEHEDNEMMRPYRIGPEDPDAPKPRPHGGM